MPIDSAQPANWHIADRISDAGAVTAIKHAFPCPARARELCSLFDAVGPDLPDVVRRLARRGPAGPLGATRGSSGSSRDCRQPLSALASPCAAATAQQPFPDLVTASETARLDFAAAPDKVDAAFNTFEFFVHHEDVRRAQLNWQPRTLPDKRPKIAVALLAPEGSTSCASSPVGVILEDSAGTN